MAKKYKNAKYNEAREARIKSGLNFKKIAVITLVTLLSLSLIGSTLISFFSAGY
ncbi:MAG: hypothetical protein M0Z31_04690 [Clostridia bacterium]|nr:hypothetical protein [Clostridia bacterium]